MKARLISGGDAQKGSIPSGSFALYALAGETVAFHPPIPERKENEQRSGSGRSGLMSALIQAEKLGQIALILPCAAFIGWLAGAWIGSKVHQVWPGAVGVVFGGAAGLYYVIRMAMAAVNDPAIADSADDKGGDGKGSGGRG